MANERLKPFRDYSEHNVINLFAFGDEAVALNATTTVYAGSCVKVKTGWSNTNELQMLGDVGAAYANTVSERYGVSADVEYTDGGADEAALGSNTGFSSPTRGISAGGLDIAFDPVGSSKDLLSPTLSKPIADIAADETWSTKIANFMTDLPSKINDAPGKTLDYVTGPEFVPDIAKGALTTTATSALMGQPEEPFYSKGVQPYMGEALSTAAKENYIADISSSFRNLTGQTPTSIAQVKNAGFYGPNDPNFFGQLAMIPQIPLPRIT